MKRAGYFLLCCLLVVCAGCSFQQINSESFAKGNSRTKSEETAEQSSFPSYEPSDGMPAVIDSSEVETEKSAGEIDPSLSQARYIGNINSKVFHKAECSLAEKLKAENKRAFSSRAEAFKAGFYPCTKCRP